MTSYCTACTDISPLPVLTYNLHLCLFWHITSSCTDISLLPVLTYHLCTYWHITSRYDSISTLHILHNTFTTYHPCVLYWYMTFACTDISPLCLPLTYQFYLYCLITSEYTSISPLHILHITIACKAYCLSLYWHITFAFTDISPLHIPEYQVSTFTNIAPLPVLTYQICLNTSENYEY